jgi:phosphinothricin acetyltransferase
MTKTDLSTVSRAMVSSDWPRVRAIYAAAMASGNATFETDPPEWDVWDEGRFALMSLRQT